MIDTNQANQDQASLEEIQKGWHEMELRLSQIEATEKALEQENRNLRYLIDSLIAHRQRSHSELILLLTNLVSKLPMNDVGMIISKLMEHNTSVSHYLSALTKGTADEPIPEPTVLKTMDHAKKDLHAAIAPLAEELLQARTPIEPAILQGLTSNPESFFSPPSVRAWRCFVKGQVPRERIVRSFGEPVLNCFVDMTTDPKLNPRPKQEEIVLAFRNDFEAVLQQNTTLQPEPKKELLDIYASVQACKANTPEAVAQRNTFQKLSFFIELLHYYEHSNTEPADVMFAQRLPALIEQLSLVTPETIDENSVKRSEDLLSHVVNPDHRQMVINNVGKGGGAARSLKYVLTLRTEKLETIDHVAIEFVRHLLPARAPKAPPLSEILPVVRLVPQAAQKAIIRALINSDRIRKSEAEALCNGLLQELGIKAIDEDKTAPQLPPEMDREIAWARVKDMVAHRADAATLTTAIRERLNSHYEADEIRASWVVLTEADPMSLIRVFCQLPYLPNGKTDPIAKPVLETYLSRLTHEKYASTYHRVLTSLKNIFRTKPDSPTLQTFLALAKWASPEAAAKIAADVGMPI